MKTFGLIALFFVAGIVFGNSRHSTKEERAFNMGWNCAIWRVECIHAEIYKGIAPQPPYYYKEWAYLCK